MVGFLLIAFEWRHMFFRERERRMDQLQNDYERSIAEQSGETYHDPRSADYTMARPFSKLFTKEWRYRGRLFYCGVALVISDLSDKWRGVGRGGRLASRTAKAVDIDGTRRTGALWPFPQITLVSAERGGLSTPRG
jgi:hypothetical protein